MMLTPSSFDTLCERLGICRNPSAPIKTKATGYDDQMNMRMPFHVGTEGMNIPLFHCSIIPIVSKANYVRFPLEFFWSGLPRE
jgi:hypothetical protein